MADAGAEVITTNNFVITPHHLSKVHLGGWLSSLTRAAARNACVAAAAPAPAGRRVLVLGCLPPLGDCYKTPELPKEMLRVVYEEIVDALEPFVDGFLAEVSTEPLTPASPMCAHAGV